MKKTEFELNNEGLLPKHIGKETNDYVLYNKGGLNVPHRFNEFILINKNRPYNHEYIIRKGFGFHDLINLIKKFDGISFEYLEN